MVAVGKASLAKKLFYREPEKEGFYECATLTPGI